MFMVKRSRCQVFLVVMSALALIPSNAFGWSVEAHQAIALIATNRLQPATTKRIASLLGKLSLVDIAVCPDQVRELEAKEIKALSAPCATIFPDPPKGTEQWHFVNTPVKDAEFTPTVSDVNAACKSVCAVVQIPRFQAVLTASKATDIGSAKIAAQQALSFIVHFIGDIHQPLHSADRNGDAGGNAEHVSFFGTDDSNELVLHHIWDDQIVTNIQKTYTALSGSLTAQIAAAAAEPKSQAMDWTLQAYLPARDVAYKDIPAADGKTDVASLGQPYQDGAGPVVELQIARAGVRLADALNTVFAARVNSETKRSSHKANVAR
jgi:nuclease S1